jgi:hypothetical protein
MLLKHVPAELLLELASPAELEAPKIDVLMLLLPVLLVLLPVSRSPLEPLDNVLTSPAELLPEAIAAPLLLLLLLRELETAEELRVPVLELVA